MTADQYITPRLQQILLFMLQEDKVYAVNQLAEAVAVSRRTVQRELNYMDQALKPYDLTFGSRTGIGVWIEGSQENKEKMLAALQQTDVLDMSDRIQRRKRLILEILKDRDLKKLYYYSNLLGVSEATVSSDLEAVEEWFASFRLHIVRRPGYGVTIEGSEKDYRWAMRSFIEENIESQLLQDFYENKNLSVLQMFGEASDKNIYAILDNDILKRVVSCLLSLNDKRILNLTENSYIGLVLHITIAINRIMKQEIIENNEYLMQTLNRDEDYEFAVYITRMLEKEFDVAIPGIESAYICLHIQGAKRQYSESDLRQHTMAHENEELIDIAYKMIDAYDEELSMILRQDEEFIQGLLAHLQPTFVRLKNKMMITNPLLDQIKKDYADIFEKCKNVAALLADWMQCEVPESETGFLAIHFGAAVVRIEQQAESRRKVRIGIVCASGIGISRLMATKVRKHFLNRVDLYTYGKTDLTPVVLESMDFLLRPWLSQRTAPIFSMSVRCWPDRIWMRWNGGSRNMRRHQRKWQRREPKKKMNSPFSLIRLTM